MRDLKTIAIILGVSIFLLWLLTASYASGIGDGTITIVPTIPPAIHAPIGGNTSIEVHQGGPDSPEIIYWNETVDLTLVEGWYGIVQRNPGGEVVDVAQYTHHILVEPVIFPEGKWFQWSPEGIFAHGNNIAFEVRKGSRPIPGPVFNNSTTVNESIGFIIPENLPLPIHPVSDFLIPRGYPVNITFNDTAQIWILAKRGEGLSNWIQPKIGNMSVNYTANETQLLRPGNYTIIIQHLGSNHIADVTYANYTRTRTDNGFDDVIYSPFGGENTTISGLQPYMIGTKMMAKIDHGMWISQNGVAYNVFDDTYDIKSLVVEDPASEITMIDEYTRGNSTENESVIHVAGYTNLPNNTALKIIFDYNSTNVRTAPDNTQMTTTIGRNIGDRRQFSILFPVYYSQLTGGGKSHFFTVIGPDGSVSTSPFHVYDMPAGQVVPLQTIRYIGGDEFKPPITVTIPVPVLGPERIVTVIQTQVVERVVEVAPWYLTPGWIALWVVIIVVILFLYWRFAT